MKIKSFHAIFVIVMCTENIVVAVETLKDENQRNLNQ
jgi:hypothetical protein